jgi:hypothetical protein
VFNLTDIRPSIPLCPSKSFCHLGILGKWFFGNAELIQSRSELASTLENSTLFQKKPEYRKALQVVSVPERVVQFRVVWEDDKGQVRTFSKFNTSIARASMLTFFFFHRSKSTAVSASSSTPLWAPTRVVSVSTLPSTCPSSSSSASSRSSRMP